jgi:CheY-like chemotaxis protein
MSVNSWVEPAGLSASAPIFGQDGSARGPETRVLVADDDEETRLVLRCALEDEGYQVVEAAHGRAAQAIVVRSGGSLVAVLDQRMPGLFGTEVMDATLGMRAIMQNRRYVLLTASPQLLPEPYCHPWFQRFVPVLSKPFDLEAFLGIVASANRELVQAHTAW